MGQKSGEKDPEFNTLAATEATDFGARAGSSVRDWSARPRR